MKKFALLLVTAFFVFTFGCVVAFAMPSGGKLLYSNVVYDGNISVDNGTTLQYPHLDVYERSDGRRYVLFAKDGGTGAIKSCWINGPITIGDTVYNIGDDGYSTPFVAYSNYWEGSGLSWRYYSNGVLLRDGFLIENKGNSGYDYFKNQSVGKTHRTDGKEYTYYLGNNGYAKTGQYGGYWYNDNYHNGIPVCARMDGVTVNDGKLFVNGSIVRNAYVKNKRTGRTYRTNNNGELIEIQFTDYSW